jgi:hypothetical protein
MSEETVIDNPFVFKVSLSVLEHLGKNLYRDFATVLGEAISNAWDADATVVNITFDKDRNYLCVQDNGDGMTALEFQDKFLKIGFRKRNHAELTANRKRPFIGRKGIGKLALLSCSETVSIITKSVGNDWVGGTIENHILDEAIKQNDSDETYELSGLSAEMISHVSADKDFTKGTCLIFLGFKGSNRNKLEYLKKILAMNFRFSLLDKDFKIIFNGEIISIAELDLLRDNTQFLWNVNNMEDPYVDSEFKNIVKIVPLNFTSEIKGFVASVVKPKQLKALGDDEKISIDLFVNGRIREKNILRHIPSAQIPESYLYGQIHYDNFEGDIDRFTSSREGVIADDPLFETFLKELQSIILKIIDQWDGLRDSVDNDGDPENTRLTPRARKSKELVNIISTDYKIAQNYDLANNVIDWLKDIKTDAGYNTTSYVDCFLSENLIRKYISYKKVSLSPEAIKEANQWKTRENENLNKANISFDIHQSKHDISYLAMDDLANLVDKLPNNAACLARDAVSYKPLRNACAHTSLLTMAAKTSLSQTLENIKARIITLLKSNTIP